MSIFVWVIALINLWIHQILQLIPKFKPFQELKAFFLRNIAATVQVHSIEKPFYVFLTWRCASNFFQDDFEEFERFTPLKFVRFVEVVFFPNLFDTLFFFVVWIDKYRSFLLLSGRWHERCVVGSDFAHLQLPLSFVHFRIAATHWILQ